jgi:hypothetical protein
MNAFETWWEREGQMLCPEGLEKECKEITRIAWDNGAYVERHGESLQDTMEKWDIQKEVYKESGTL